MKGAKMKSVNELWQKGYAVIPAEIRGAKPDSYEYTSKKDGHKVTKEIVRVSIEIEQEGSWVSASGVINGTKTVPPWCNRGDRVYLGCTEIRQENFRMVMTIADACPQKA